jgi:hypothetical protein
VYYEAKSKRFMQFIQQTTDWSIALIYFLLRYYWLNFKGKHKANTQNASFTWLIDLLIVFKISRYCLYKQNLFKQWQQPVKDNKKIHKISAHILHQWCTRMNEKSFWIVNFKRMFIKVFFIKYCQIEKVLQLRCDAEVFEIINTLINLCFILVRNEKTLISELTTITKNNHFQWKFSENHFQWKKRWNINFYWI